jgi:2-phospho-L-lactate guanylyltransferase
MSADGPLRDVWAVVPVKEFTGAKQRLASAYPQSFRSGLARAMFLDILTALGGVRRLAGIMVVTADPEATRIAREHGARIHAENTRDGQTVAVSAAARKLTAEGCTTMLAMPADIPLASIDEIAWLIDEHGPAPAFTIVPAHDRRGSNAILCSPPDLVPLAFGNDSFPDHLASARVLGIEPRIVPMPGIGLDVDNPPDLAEFLRQPSRTHAWDYAVAQGIATPATSWADI